MERMFVTLETFFSIWVVGGITHTRTHTHTHTEHRVNGIGWDHIFKKMKLSGEREIYWEEKGRNGMG